MKKLMLTAVILLNGFSVFAAQARYPMIQVGGLFITVDEFCKSEDMLNAGLREICVERETCERGDCIATEVREFITPIHYIDTICVERELNDRGDCLQWESVNATHPLTYEIPFYNVNGENDRLLYTKTYTIPDCE